MTMKNKKGTDQSSYEQTAEIKQKGDKLKNELEDILGEKLHLGSKKIFDQYLSIS